MIKWGVIAGVLLLIIHAVIWKLGLYSKIPIIDIPMHIAGGMILSCILAGSFCLKNFRRDIDLYFCAWVLFGVTFGAVIWEYLEYSLNILFKINWQNSIGDTLKDVLMAQFGSTLVIIYLYIRNMCKMGPRA